MGTEKRFFSIFIVGKVVERVTRQLKDEIFGCKIPVFYFKKIGGFILLEFCDFCHKKTDCIKF